MRIVKPVVSSASHESYLDISEHLHRYIGDLSGINKFLMTNMKINFYFRMIRL